MEAYQRRASSSSIAEGMLPGGPTSLPGAPRRGRQESGSRHRRTASLLLLLVAILGLVVFFPSPSGPAAAEGGTEQQAAAAALGDASVDGRILVSYSYFEKDAMQRENFEFFITAGMGVGNVLRGAPPGVDFVAVVNGKVCRPCTRLYPLVQEAPDTLVDSLSHAYVGEGLSLLKRVANEGMDFAAHNSTLSWLAAQGRLGKYKYYIFLNSSVRGPFVPSYMPPGWQWTQAFTDRLRGDVKAAGSSLVCLPEVDAGGFGPKLESWAFVVDQDALEALLQDGVFHVRTCKLCKEEGVVVGGEYGLTSSLLRRGYNVDTLMAKYRGVDWRQQRHWRCNNNVHPSRHGTYDQISMHPFETVFLKASWHVGQPFLDKYTQWAVAQAGGQDTTGGSFDEGMYRYAISPEAQADHRVERCYSVRSGFQ